MKKVIYSLYIDIPKEELDIFDKNILKEGVPPINYVTKSQFKDNYDDLVACKQAYAFANNIEFKMFELDSNYINYQKQLQTKYPYLTTYNVINFYKIYLMYELAKDYDEILYLDFDVVPMKFANFFEHWDLTKGIAVLDNSDAVSKIESVTETSTTIRSPTAKYYNAQAMLFEKGLSTDNQVINTGIIGANKEHIFKLKYFDDFDNNLSLMSSLKNGHDMWPKKITNYFGWDNETLFSVKLKENNIPVLWLDSKWHFFFSKQPWVPDEVIMCHTINKRFDIVWKKINA